MCGIVGVINRSRGCHPLEWEGVKCLEKAMQVQKHRGPDDEGIVGFLYDGKVIASENSAGLSVLNEYDGLWGVNRLSIKDLSKYGHQPMLSSDKK